MNWAIKLGENCDYKDYSKMIENHELDDMIPLSGLIVEQFIKRFPTVPIDTVVVTINKDAAITTEIKEVVIKTGDKL